MHKVAKSCQKAKKSGEKSKFLSALFMGWVMGLEPITKTYKIIGIA